MLAARKRLGTEAAVTGEIPDDAALAGERFFNLNFGNGDYGSRDRTFEMTLEEDYSITGRATVVVPTTIMAIFGFTEMPIRVECQAQLNMANTDVMMVLDVTGSMAEINPGDTVPKIDALKTTVRNFYAQLTANAPKTTRLRFGFVPYSTNVNVGSILSDAWVNNQWHYQSRELIKETGTETTRSYDRNWKNVSGSVDPATVTSSYAGTFHAATAGYTYLDANENVITVPAKAAYYSCDGSTPASSFDRKDKKIDTASEPFAGPPTGTRKIETYERTEKGTYNWTELAGATCNVKSQVYNDYVRTYEWVTDPYQAVSYKWRYDQLNRDVGDWRTASNGCMEERATYDIDDYDDVDLTRALDLDLNLVPTSDPDTKWSPMYPNVVYARSKNYWGGGKFDKGQKVTSEDYVSPAVIGSASCPAAARKLATMSSSQLDTYLATLKPVGSTYHDIGMSCRPRCPMLKVS